MPKAVRANHNLVIGFVNADWRTTILNLLSQSTTAFAVADNRGSACQRVARSVACPLGGLCSRHVCVWCVRCHLFRATDASCAAHNTLCATH